jgi:hypothetical protein
VSALSALVIVFGALAIALASAIGATSLLLFRLSRSHPSVFDELKRPRVLLRSAASDIRLRRFLDESHYAKLGDPWLRAVGVATRVTRVALFSITILGGVLLGWIALS